jgi:tRNA(fMet)-specific endonuclease VapC
MNTAGSVLLDTNVVIAHFRSDPDLTARLRATAAVYLPWVVLGELHYGALRAQRREAQLALIREFLQTATLLLPERSTSERYGEVKAELAGIGKLIPDNDIWIAATAREFDLPLATRDAHFAHVPGLQTLAW